MTADSHGESDAPKAGSSTAAIQPRVEAGGDSGPLAQCAAPAQRVWPAQFVSFQREITSTEDAEHEFQLSLKGWPIEAHLKVSVLASFIQQWTVREVGIGDLAATVSLGPGEVYTIEIRNTRRTLLEESRETASTIEDASEQTSSDKEALTVANTSSRASNWSVAGSGGFSMSGVGASGSATQSGTISNSVARTINEVHDTTLRSSRKLSTQTKIQIRGVTESTVETRETRNLRNPFMDRALTLNLYEVNKRFEVQTAQDLLRPMITAHFSPLDFSDEQAAKRFVASSMPFLQQSLLDPELAAALPGIVGAMRQVESRMERRREAEVRLEEALKVVEEYLFDNRPGWQPYHHSEFEEDIIYGKKGTKAIGAFADAGPNTASADAGDVGADALQLFLVLHTAHTLRQWALTHHADIFASERQKFLASLAVEVEALWTTSLDDGKRWSLLDRNQKTELFRRIPGFLFLYKSVVENASLPPEEDSEIASLTVALLEHLRRHAGYYTEQYMRFLWDRLGRAFVVELANSILHFVFTGDTQGHVDGCRPYRNLYRVEEVQRDGLCILIPLERVENFGQSTSEPGKKFATALATLVKELDKVQAPKPSSADVVVPADGLHIEPVAGACVLPLPKKEPGPGGGGPPGHGDPH